MQSSVGTSGWPFKPLQAAFFRVMLDPGDQATFSQITSLRHMLCGIRELSIQSFSLLIHSYYTKLFAYIDIPSVSQLHSCLLIREKHERSHYAFVAVVIMVFILSVSTVTISKIEFIIFSYFLKMM